MMARGHYDFTPEGEPVPLDQEAHDFVRDHGISGHTFAVWEREEPVDGRAALHA